MNVSNTGSVPFCSINITTIPVSFKVIVNIVINNYYFLRE